MRNILFLLMLFFEPISAKELPKIKKPLPRVLYIGDSHSVGVFGHSITTLIRDALPKNVAFMAAASCGSEPRWWLDGKITNCGLRTLYPNGFDDEIHKAQTPKIAELLNIVQPKITIVQLGSNLVLMNDEEREKATDEMMALVEHKGGQCVWVSAPDSRKFSSAELGNVYELLKKLAKKHRCKLIDSRKYTKYPAGGDGLHYGGKDGVPIAKYWAEKVFVNAVKPLLEKNFTIIKKTPIKSVLNVEHSIHKIKIKPDLVKNYANKKRK